MKKILLAATLALLSLAASGEKADSFKDAVIVARHTDIDRVNGIHILSGDVMLTRGTLVLKADKATVRELPDGYLLVSLTAEPGKLASFRQKEDSGPDVWVEGQAQRIDYEEKIEVVKLFSKAELKQLESTRLRSKVEGEFISYDSRKEKVALRNDASGEDKLNGGLTTFVIGARKPAPPAAAVKP